MALRAPASPVAPPQVAPAVAVHTVPLRAPTAPVSAPRRGRPRIHWERAAGLVVLLAALVAGGWLRVWVALHDDGIYWPDEIFKSLEPAHRLLTGYGLYPWEFVRGATSWAFPGLVAGVMLAARGAGFSGPADQIHAVRLVLALCGTGAVFATYRLARACGARTLPAACGASLFALAVPALYFGSRPLSETAALLPVVLGLAVALRPEARPWQVTLGTSLLGLAVLLRLQDGVFALGLLATLVGRRSWRSALQCALVLEYWALLYGLLDRLTWGGWFHAAHAYLRFTVAGGSDRWGTAPFGWYFGVYGRALGPVAPVLALLALAGLWRARGVGLTAAAFVLLHCAVAHKEARFLLPALPVVAALAGVGLDTLTTTRSRWVRAVGVAGVLAVAVLSATGFRDLTWRDVGLDRSFASASTAYDHQGDVNRLLLVAHTLPDLCGLKVDATALAWTGGYSYLDRPVPIYTDPAPSRTSGAYDYAIGSKASPAPGRIVATQGLYALIRLPVVGCTPSFGPLDRLPGDPSDDPRAQAHG